jgi:glutathione S-transferase
LIVSSEVSVATQLSSNEPATVGSPKLTLYLMPNSSSLAVHIALREIGVNFEARVLSGAEKETRKPEFLKINPAGQVPVLLIDDRALTEVAGILFYLARRFPEAGLLPVNDPENEARIIAWMSFLASSAHGAWRVGGEDAVRIYEIAEHRMAPSGWAVDSGFSIADIHLFRLFWRFHASAPISRETFPRLFAHHDRVLARPSVRDALRAEAVTS